MYKCRFNSIISSDMKMVRLMLAIGAMLWSIFLVWPMVLGTHLFPTEAQIMLGAGRTTYSLMAQIAPEWFWALLFGLHGLFLFFSVFFKISSSACVLDAFNGALIWSLATGACYLAHFNSWSTYLPPAAMGMDVAAVLASWWWLVRVIVDKEYEARH